MSTIWRTRRSVTLFPMILVLIALLGPFQSYCHYRWFNSLAEAFIIVNGLSGTTRGSKTTSFRFGKKTGPVPPLRSSYDPDAAASFDNNDNGDDSDKKQNNSNNNSDGDKDHDWDTEETLMVLHLAPMDDVTVDDAYDQVSQYVQAFPYAAVLPVQPLQYVPTDDGGVHVKFLRKKTHIKPGVDGGIRLFVTKRLLPATSTANQDDDDDDDDDDDELDVLSSDTGAKESSAGGGATIEIIAKRNSSGQSLSKIFAEKLVIKTLVKGLLDGGVTKAAASMTTPIDSNKDDMSNSASMDSIVAPATRIPSPTADFVTTRSVFHKWMQ